jgi:hypothetical protein
LLCHEEYQKLVHSSKPIWTPYISTRINISLANVVLKKSNAST